jgi:hypothetical protein
MVYCRVYAKDVNRNSLCVESSNIMNSRVLVQRSRWLRSRSLEEEWSSGFQQKGQSEGFCLYRNIPRRGLD